MVKPVDKLIEFHLGQLYASDVLSQGNHQLNKEAFKKILVPGSQEEKAARKRLSEVAALPRVMGKSQCFISDKHFLYLTEVLT